MAIYKIYVNDRSYTSWEIFDTANFNKIILDIVPIESKLFSNDALAKAWCTNNNFEPKKFITLEFKILTKK